MAEGCRSVADTSRRSRTDRRQVGRGNSAPAESPPLRTSAHRAPSRGGSRVSEPLDRLVLAASDGSFRRRRYGALDMGRGAARRWLWAAGDFGCPQLGVEAGGWQGLVVVETGSLVQAGSGRSLGGGSAAVAGGASVCSATCRWHDDSPRRDRGLRRRQPDRRVRRHGRHGGGLQNGGGLWRCGTATAIDGRRQPSLWGGNCVAGVGVLGLRRWDTGQARGVRGSWAISWTLVGHAVGG
jgi:hypothetical protein